MGYRVGDTVVYPHHGAGVVESTQQRELDGEPCRYLVVRMSYGDLTVMVPEAACTRVGVREVVSDQDVQRVLDVLRNVRGERRGSWARRFKENATRLHSGDVFAIAEVVRNLTVRELESSLSPGERRMMGDAKRLLLSELAVAMGCDEQQADELIRRVMLKALEAV